MQSRKNQALTTLTWLDFETLEMVEYQFRYYFDNYTPFPKDGTIIALKHKLIGQQRMLSAADSLGLVLAWTRSQGSLMIRELIFGMTQTTVSDYLHFCMVILIRKLQKVDRAKISQPNIERIAEYQQGVMQQHPTLDNV